MRTHIKLVERQDWVAVVKNDRVLDILLQLFEEKNLGGAYLLAFHEAIKLTIVIMTAELDLGVDAKGLSNDNLQMWVKLWLDQHLRSEVVQVHNDLVLEVELLATLSINKLLLNKLLHKEHIRTVLSAKIIKVREKVSYTSFVEVFDKMRRIRDRKRRFLLTWLHFEGWAWTLCRPWMEPESTVDLRWATEWKSLDSSPWAAGHNLLWLEPLGNSNGFSSFATQIDTTSQAGSQRDEHFRIQIQCLRLPVWEWLWSQLRWRIQSPLSSWRAA